MKKLILFISLLLIFGMLYVALINNKDTITLNYLYSSLLQAQNDAGIIDTGAYFTFKIRPSALIFLSLCCGFLTGASIFSIFWGAQKDRVRAFQRELERSAISGENNASKVGVLEAKIKTLEKAFNTVIDERTQLELQIKELNAEIDNLNNK